MVSMMDVEPKGQICDSRPPMLSQSAISQRSIELHLEQQQQQQQQQQQNDTELAKKALKLDLKDKTTQGMNLPEQTKKHPNEKDIKSPKSPLSQSGIVGGTTGSGRILPHQTSITSQIDLVEDRKALRDALYQGIFHRHRRTIFAVGSFLRMLRSRNSAYNTIRSSSEGDDEGR